MEEEKGGEGRRREGGGEKRRGRHRGEEGGVGGELQAYQAADTLLAPLQGPPQCGHTTTGKQV